MNVSTAIRAAGHRLALSGPRPISDRHVEPSLLAPVHGRCSDRLIDVAIAATTHARTVDHAELATRTTDEFVEVWPGEHYKLLTGLVATLRPQTIVEIGTATGMSALAMKAALPEDGRIVTYDLIDWHDYPGAVLREEDLADGRLEQRLDDLSSPEGWRSNADILASADFIFADAAKDGQQERDFLRAFEDVGLAHAPIVMFDDIRVWNMLAIWREIERPKLDLTSFGHWSGTGLVDFA